MPDNAGHCRRCTPIVSQRHTHCLRASCAGDNYYFCDSYDPARVGGARADTCRARAGRRRVASVRKRVLVFCPALPRSDDRTIGLGEFIQLCTAADFHTDSKYCIDTGRPRCIYMCFILLYVFVL